MYSSKEKKRKEIKTSFIALLVVDFRELQKQGATYFFC
jgi:hypothetical protein